MQNKIIQPVLRFPEFKGKWNMKTFGELTSRISNSVTVDLNGRYQQIGIRSHGKGIFHKEFVSGKSLGNKRVFWIVEHALIVNIVFAWELAIAKTTEKETGMIASHRFPMYLPIPTLSDLNYLLFFFLTKKGASLLEIASPGGAGRNKTLGQKEFEKLKLFIPEITEQRKIAEFLSSIDKKLAILKKKRALLEQYKKGVMQKLFSQELRFKDQNGKTFPMWEIKELGECLDYIQPTKYLVTNTDYNNSYNTPVLTAGKKFILGYTNENDGVFEKELPAIIFDDFTTATKFVDFPFKVKSTAMKILVASSDVNIKFLFEAMQLLKYEIGGHERHWISKFAQMKISVPCLPEQLRIADFLSSLDQKIRYAQTQLEQTEQYKKGLLQQMFC